MPITLLIKRSDQDKIYNVEVDPQSNVEELLSELKDSCGFNQSTNLELLFNGKVLASNQNFKENQIPKGALLMLQISQNQQLKQFIRVTFSCPEKNKIQKTEVEVSETLGKWADFLVQDYGLSNAVTITFFLNGQVLKPEQTFKQQSVEDGAQIEAKILRVGG